VGLPLKNKPPHHTQGIFQNVFTPKDNKFNSSFSRSADLSSRKAHYFPVLSIDILLLTIVKTREWLPPPFPVV
jgi:hypothetical protein